MIRQTPFQRLDDAPLVDGEALGVYEFPLLEPDACSCLAPVFHPDHKKSVEPPEPEEKQDEKRCAHYGVKGGPVESVGVLLSRYRLIASRTTWSRSPARVCLDIP